MTKPLPPLSRAHKSMTFSACETLFLPSAADADARRNAPVSVHVKLEQAERSQLARKFNDDEERCPPNDFIKKENNADRHEREQQLKQEEKEVEEEEEEIDVGKRRGQKRPLHFYPSSNPRTRQTYVTAEHRHRLEALLHNLVREHRWKEAAGALSVLLSGPPPSTSKICEDNLRRDHMVAMELHKRFFSGNGWRYPMQVGNIYDLWVSKLSQSKDETRKKNAIQMEEAMFYFVRGDLHGARAKMQKVIEDRDLTNEPSVNLLYGMILYQLWYSGLPDNFKIKDFNNCIPTETSELSFNGDYQEIEIGESSHDHYAAVTEATKSASGYASISSFGNEKVFEGCKNVGPKAEFGNKGFYVSQSTDKNEENFGSCNLDDLRNSSIFFAHGLDTSLLPIRLDHLTGDIQQIIYRYRKLTDEHYRDAVKHLRRALHSTNPVNAALLPLIQLLLLGDRVEEAFTELKYSCQYIDTALPFRLMARLLECFQSNEITLICSYYESALKRDPICHRSLERLVKMHKSGNCSTMLMFEMIALYLDASDGQCTIWEELTSCFLQLQTPCDYEDYTSNTLQRGGTNTLPSIRVPKALTKKSSRCSWKLRFRWWKRRHFGNSSLTEQASDQKMLCFKAACASHLYGPKYEYVIRVFESLRTNEDLVAVLTTHMQNAMNLYEHL